ncbi:hypothetical protein NLU13_3005 [Sarocladium strictum]|uniref:ubiquitinyl hydrolase 1 n=1 Tax=Sarocladium strictum TaxID=5046 RepID=A0AA39GL73_SARSR|nr:hypothetical protein NLU13_3005 [Sarocladium strictum]
MNGDADVPNRSSSPLKRRASSMEPEENGNKNGGAGFANSTYEDGTGDHVRAMSVDMPDADDAVVVNETSHAMPPLLEQIKIIETLLKAFREAPVKAGDKAFIVSRSWVDRALSLRDESGKVASDVGGTTLGPIDNSDIIEEQSKDSSDQPFTRLKPGSGLEEFELFPEDAWNMVIEWYGIKEGQDPIVRTAIETADPGTESNVMYEFHPTIFKAHRLWSEISPLPIEQSLKARNPPPLRLVRSRKYHAQTFLKELKQLSGIPLDRRVRLWTVPETLPAVELSRPRSALTPPDSPGTEGPSENAQASWPNLLLDLPSFNSVKDQRMKVELVDHTWSQNYNGKSSLQLYNLVSDQTLVLDENVESDEYVSTYSGRSRGAQRSLPARGAGMAPASRTNSGRSSPAPQGPTTRGRTQKSRHGRSLGAVGLHNLGNTCYMNSALQCVRSVEELTKYFLTDAYVDEVNKTNPLGYNGKVALAYMGLLRDIYAEGRGSVSPRDFKGTVGRCRSTFAGWGQQDSQEFLGFLLDALQEDLSRIVNKPYIEKPDSTDDMINDPEAIRRMAEQVWDITRKRDDSVIADLFTGMYKSTLQCPVCDKISITFDPFNNLTLPLPIENMWIGTIKFFPLNDAPVQIDVELPKHSAIDALRKFISERTGVPVDRLIGGEEYKEKFFKIYDNTQDVSGEIHQNDVATFHELESVPTNWPSKGRKQKVRSMLDIDTPIETEELDDPRYERMVVPVFHRRPEAVGRNDGAAPPHFIVLTKDEASNYDVIRRKVLEKIATLSTWTKFSEMPSSEAVDAGDSDVVVTSTSDADSSGDSKIAARSVEGEEDMLDISMKDGNGSNKEHKPDSKILKHFNHKRPAFVDPDVFIDPQLYQLFELTYFHDNSDGSVPTGWHKLDNSSQSLPKISDRIPESSTEDGDAASPESWNSVASGNDDSSDEDAAKEESDVTRMNDESSEEDMPKGARFARRGAAQIRGGRKKFKDHKSYGKKGNKRRDKAMRKNKDAQRIAAVKPQPTPPAVADGGPLIRLGEGLVVEWKEDAWETVFGSSLKNPDSFQGGRTFVDVETLHDPALKQNQRRRQSRRSRGITLDECLDEFERAEVLSEQDMWYCPRCKEHRRASKKFDLWKTPDILVAHLKRFSSSGWRRDKLDVLVDFPIEGLDLTSRVIQKEEGQDEIYDLIAVDDHYGGLGGGHYTAYARNFADGEWYNYNDSSVSKVKDPSSVVTSAAYLLFYRRRSSKPLGGPRFAKIFEQFDHVDDADEGEDDDEFAHAGEGQRLGGHSSPTESQHNVSKVGAIRPQAARNETTTTITAVNGSDEEDLPPYSEPAGSAVVHNSIEADEGIEMRDDYQPLSFNAMQTWNFDNLNDNAKAGTPDHDYASDSAQADLSDNEYGIDGQTDVDMEMTSGVTTDVFDESSTLPAADDNAQIALADIQNDAWDRKDVLKIPAAGRSEGSSDVAEIRLDSDHRA